MSGCRLALANTDTIARCFPFVNAPEQFFCKKKGEGVATLSHRGRPGSVVAALQLKVSLGMRAHRALDRGMLADIDIAAVTALPDLLGLAGKDLAGLDVGGQGLVALLVLLDRKSVV